MQYFKQQMNLLSVIFLVLVFLGLLFRCNVKKSFASKIFCIVCCITLSILSAIRSTKSISDTATYINEFDIVSAYKYEYIIKQFPSCFGYYCLNKLFASLGLNVRVLFLLVALLFNTVIFIFIYKNSSNTVLSFIIYVSTGLFAFSMAAMKQTMAMSFCILAYLYFDKKRKLLIPFLLVLIASTFHQSALFFVGILIICTFKLSKKWNVIFAIGCAFLIICGPSLIKFFVLYLDSIGNRFGYYKDDVSEMNLVGFFIQLLFVFFYIVYYKKLKEEKNPSIFYVLVLSLPFFYLTTVVSSLFRVAYYLVFFNFSLFPNLLSNEKNPEIRTILSICSGLLFITYFVFFSNINYVTMWS